MRKGFTLIELMIVIAIIAIIAAIAIPNLLESRITANESAAATSLKSGIFPAQTQFAAGGYLDGDTDRRGEYGWIKQLSGAESIATGIDLTLLGAEFTHSASAGNGAETDEVQGFLFSSYLDTTSATLATNNREKYYAIAARPEVFDDTGRRAFVMTQDGKVNARSPLVEFVSTTTLMADAFVTATDSGNRTLSGGSTWGPVSK